MTKTPIYRTKTFWTGVVTGVTALGSYLAGEISIGMALNLAATALVGVFIRDGISREARR